MKKLFTFFMAALLCVTAFAQQVVLVFIGQDSVAGVNVQLSRIELTNHTQGWTEILNYPDTVAVLNVETGTGLGEYAAEGVFGLAQNSPNPFNGITGANLTVVESGTVMMEVADANGRVVITRKFASLPCGTHQFRINVDRAGVYFLTARQNGMASSVKMVNNDAGHGNGIEYVGVAVEAQNIEHSVKKIGTRGAINRPFAYGDEMSYKEFVIIDGEEIEGARVELTITQAETITLPIELATIEEVEDGQPCPRTPTLTDAQEHTYNTVKIGTQCWMKENLRTTIYPDQTEISNGVITSYDYPLWYYPNGVASNEEIYGLLYNWKAVMHDETAVGEQDNVQGICPDGWHVPSDAEWQQLTDYVSSQSRYICPGNADNIAKALVSTSVVQTSTEPCAVGNEPSTNNATGFTALLAGAYNGNDNFNYGSTAYFWSSTSGDDTSAYSRSLYYSRATVTRNPNFKCLGFSVRCIRNLQVW